MTTTNHGLTLADRVAGAIWGHLVGDAMGVPYEFRPAVPAERVRFGATGTWGKPPGTWSDDGALMLATLDSLLHAGPGGTPAFDVADMGARFVRWYRHGDYTPGGEGRFDIGGTTEDALLRIEAGVPAVEAGGTGERTKANGSLMRILPIALVDRGIGDADLVRRAMQASQITHANPVPMAACALYVLIARRLLEGADDLAPVLVEADGRFVALGELGVLDPEPIDELRSWAGREPQGRGGVCDAFWSAWKAACEADSYAATIRTAIAYGNDTDTTACIAGGLAGIRWGLEGIPAEWRVGMRDRDQVERAVNAVIG